MALFRPAGAGGGADVNFDCEGRGKGVAGGGFDGEVDGGEEGCLGGGEAGGAGGAR